MNILHHPHPPHPPRPSSYPLHPPRSFGASSHLRTGTLPANQVRSRSSALTYPSKLCSHPMPIINHSIRRVHQHSTSTDPSSMTGRPSACPPPSPSLSPCQVVACLSLTVYAAFGVSLETQLGFADQHSAFVSLAGRALHSVLCGALQCRVKCCAQLRGAAWCC